MAVTLGACTGNIGGDGGDLAAPTVDAFVHALPAFDLPPEEPKTELDCDELCPAPEQEGDFLCEYRRYTETSHKSHFVAFQPNSATLWPGAVVRGDDAREGLLSPVGVPLGAMSFSISLETLSGDPRGEMAAPSLSAFRQARNAILAEGVRGATPASTTFEVEQIHNASQFDFKLGVKAKWPRGGVENLFSFSNRDTTTRFLVDFTQAYYTIDLDTPVSPSDFFADGTTVEDLQPYMDMESPPLYVQSITYGRRVLFAFESSTQAKALENALKASFNAWVVKGSIELDIEQRKVIEESSVQAFILGGSGASASKAITVTDVESLQRLLVEGGDYDASSPGAPIGYKLAYLDNTTTHMAFATDYAEKVCTKTRGRLRAELTRVEQKAGQDENGYFLEPYGEVTVRVPQPNDPVVDCDTGGVVQTVLALDRDHYIKFPETSAWQPTSPPYTTFDAIPFGPGERLCIRATFTDRDSSGGDDDLGTYDQILTWEDGWSGEQVLNLFGTQGSHLEVAVNLTAE